MSLKAQKAAMETQNAQLASQKASQNQQNKQRPSIESVKAGGSVKLTSEQYHSFKKTPEQMLILQHEHQRLLKEQQKVSILQQRAKTPISQQRLAQNAQKVSQNLARISQQIAQSKLAETYEQFLKGKTGTASAKSSTAMPSGTQKLFDANPSHRLLAVVQAYEKDKAAVLVAVGGRLKGLSQDLGFRLEPTFQKNVPAV